MADYMRGISNGVEASLNGEWVVTLTRAFGTATTSGDPGAFTLPILSVRVAILLAHCEQCDASGVSSGCLPLGIVQRVEGTVIMAQL